MSQAYKYRVTLELFSAHPIRAEEMALMVVGPVLVDRVLMHLVRSRYVTDPHLVREEYKADRTKDEYARFKMLELDP